MSGYSSTLAETADLLAGDVGRLTFALRTRIERGLFITAKEIVRRFMGQELSSFSLAARQQIEGAAESQSVRDDVRDALLLAFELQAVLAKLTSTDPYVACEALGEAVPGRNQAVQSLGRSVKRYAELSAILLKDVPT